MTGTGTEAPAMVTLPAGELAAFALAAERTEKALADLAARLDAEVAQAVKAERERITALFGEWIEVAMSEPNAHGPEAWKAAFAGLISGEFRITDPEAAP